MSKRRQFLLSRKKVIFKSRLKLLGLKMMIKIWTTLLKKLPRNGTLTQRTLLASVSKKVCQSSKLVFRSKNECVYFI